MIKKIIYSLMMVVLVVFIATIKPSFVSAEEDESNYLVIETNIEDDRFDNLEAVKIQDCIYIYDEDGNPYTGQITYKINDSEELTITLSSGKFFLPPSQGNTKDVVVIKDIPQNCTYKIETIQASSTYIDVDIENGEGTIGGGKKIVKVNVKVHVVDQQFRMNISGVYDDLEIPIYITVYEYDNKAKPKENIKYNVVRNGEIIYTGEMKKSSGIMGKIDLIWLKHGDSVILKDLPAAYETWNSSWNLNLFKERYGFAITDPKITGIGPEYLASDGVAERLYINFSFYPLYYSSRLVIEKKSNGEGIEKDKEFTFKIRGYYPSLIDDDLEYKITGNYPYTKYKVTEEVDPETSETITKEEEIGTGTLELDENGIGYIKLKADEKVIIGEDFVWVDEAGNVLKKKPEQTETVRPALIREFINHGFILGSKFEITEEDNGYDFEVIGTAFIEAGTSRYLSTYTVTNTRKFTGKLTINKKVSGNDEDKNKEFNFKIKLEDGASDIPTTYKYTGSKEGELEFDENFEATITLKDGESITIEGLPVGAKYAVEEDDYSKEGYTTTVVGGTGTIKDGDTETVTASFTNHKNIDTTDAPQTGDKIGSWLIVMIISILGIVSTLFIVKKRYLKV